MSGNADDPLLSVAGKISKGEPVDWKELQEQVATPDQAAVVEELRSLERYARVNEAIPKSWDRFQIIGVVGVGEFGIVYRAFDPQLQIEVALKITKLRPHADMPVIPAESAGLDEPRRLARVTHPNVVRLFGVDRIGDEIGIVMEYVHGQTLEQIVRQQGPFGANEATVIGIDFCRALAAVHSCAVLHGDIKASNVMREDGGRLVLMDFGAGRHIKDYLAGPGMDFAGTPLYLAPEIFSGAPRSIRSEIYSVGVLLYFLVTGSHPVEGDSLTAIRRLHKQRGACKPLRDVRPDLPDGFIRVVERALSEKPEGRFYSAGDLETALVRLLQPAAEVEPSASPSPSPSPSVTPPPSPKLKILLAAFSLLVLVVAAFTVAQLRAPSTAPGQSPAAATPPPDVTTVSTGPPSTGAPDGEYRIDAAFYREKSGSIERLKPGTKVAPNEALSLQVELSAPAYVYVVNEDESGESYLLFPLPGLALTNPLPPGQRHRLPGMWNGEPISWQITSTGKKEHFLIVASPQPSREFAELFASLRQPSFGKPAAQKLSGDEILTLRSAGGLTTSPARKDQQLRLSPEFATPLAAVEERVRGVWIRHATFDNP
jgi:serine/threonine-protein kinase